MCEIVIIIQVSLYKVMEISIVLLHSYAEFIVYTLPFLVKLKFVTADQFLELSIRGLFLLRRASL